jgi:hypothetical protein
MVKAEVPDLDRFVDRLETELGLDRDYIIRLGQEERGSESWQAVRGQGR